MGIQRLGTNGHELGSDGPSQQHGELTVRTQEVLAKLFKSAHEGAISLTGARPETERDSTPSPNAGSSLATVAFMPLNSRKPTLRNGKIKNVVIITEHTGSKPEPSNTSRISVKTELENGGPLSEAIETTIIFREIVGEEFRVVADTEGPFNSEKTTLPHVQVLGAVVAAQALRDGAVDAGGNLTPENNVDYPAVCGILQEWEQVIPGHLEGLLGSLGHYGYDVSALTPPPQTA